MSFQTDSKLLVKPVGHRCIDGQLGGDVVAALDRCSRDLDSYRLAGDWRVYLEVLADSPGRVGVVASPLNVHRRHAAGVTASLAPERHVEEVARMHALARARLGLSPEIVRRQAGYRRRLAHELGVAPTGAKARPSSPGAAKTRRHVAAE